MGKLENWITKLDARHRLGFSLVASISVWLALRHRVHVSTKFILTWDVFALCVIILAWLTIVFTPPHKLRARAQEQDLSRTLMFVFALLAACAGLFAVGFLFLANRGVQDPHFIAHEPSCGRFGLGAIAHRFWTEVCAYVLWRS